MKSIFSYCLTYKFEVHDKTVDDLKEAIQDINKSICLGDTALIAVLRAGRNSTDVKEATQRLLIDHGADRSMSNIFGTTHLHYLAGYYSSPMITYSHDIRQCSSGIPI